MTDKVYANGRVYKLYSHINTLRHRLHGHIRRPPSCKVSEWFKDIGVENVKIIKLAEYQNLTKDTLL